MCGVPSAVNTVESYYHVSTMILYYSTKLILLIVKLFG